MSDVSTWLWAKGFKPKIGEPWTADDHQKVDQLRAEIKRLENTIAKCGEASWKQELGHWKAAATSWMVKCDRLEAENVWLKKYVVACALDDAVPHYLHTDCPEPLADLLKQIYFDGH